MRTEKMLAALLAGLIILSLTGCGADKINDGSESGAISTESSITATVTDSTSEPTAESSLHEGTESTTKSTAEKEKAESTAPADSGRKADTAKPAETESPTAPPKQTEPPKVTEPLESKPDETPKSVDLSQVLYMASIKAISSSTPTPPTQTAVLRPNTISAATIGRFVRSAPPRDI